MAATGYTPILLYSSSTASTAPSAGNLTNSTLGSELAINITDGKLFYKDNANAVQVIGWKTTPTTAGGTGLTSYTTGDLLYFATGTTLSKLGIGTADYVMTSSGTAPQWSQFLKAKAGGTGQTSFAVGDLLYADTTTTLAKLADVATGNALISGGVGVAPSWGKIGLTTHVSGTLPVANGGTGLTTFGPSFSARNSSNQSISSATFTKVTLDTEEFDPNNNFASSTFTPTVAGYYQINCTIRFNGVTVTGGIVAIYKNGSAFIRVVETNFSIGTDFTLSGSAVVYCNGSTDTIEMYGLISGTSPNFNYANATACCQMSGAYLRGT
ncbi:hypothetical protein EBZ39_02095 [bacterium]|nr:hypothetical protein [bacterium]